MSNARMTRDEYHKIPARSKRRSVRAVAEREFAQRAGLIPQAQEGAVASHKKALVKPKPRKAGKVKPKPPTEHEEREVKTSVRFVLGVDPGVETGLAYFDGVSREWLDVGTADFHALMSWADSVPKENLGRFVVIVENAKAMPVFRRKYGEKEARAAQAQARSIGQNNRESELVIGELRRRGFWVVEYAPKSTWKNKVHKWTQEECKSITGYAPRTNQHVRDAMRMAWEHRHLANMPENTRVLSK